MEIRLSLSARLTASLTVVLLSVSAASAAKLDCSKVVWEPRWSENWCAKRLSGPLSPIRPEALLVRSKVSTRGDSRSSPRAAAEEPRGNIAILGQIETDYFGLTDRTWKTNEIPFFIDDNVGAEQKSNIRTALCFWQETTGVTFIEEENLSSDSLLFADPPSSATMDCYTSGRDVFRAALQTYSDYVNVRCTDNKVRTSEKDSILYNLAHEIGHVLGLSHEQNRPDRNLHVEISFLTRIADPQYRGIWGWDVLESFKKESNRIELATAKYDFASAMHYFFDEDMKPKEGVSTSPVTPDQVGRTGCISPLDACLIREAYRNKPARLDGSPAAPIDPATIRNQCR